MRTLDKQDYTFDSNIRYGKQVGEFVQEIIKNEPMFFNSSPDFAYDNGGPITRAFLDALDESPVVFDSRVHMLMPGWFPAIPGYHHDDVPRNTADGQPNYDSPTYHSRHAMMLINGDVAPTDFALGRHVLPKVEGNEGPIYKRWHEEVVRQIEQGELNRVSAESGRVIYFDWQSMHQATPAVSSGWRWFGRASFQTDRKPTNEIRKQVQVYLQNPMEGW